VVMCSDERQETIGIEEDNSSSNSLYGSSGSSQSTTQSAREAEASNREVVETQVSVSEGSLALSAKAISWVVKVTCDFGFPDYGIDPNSSAYVVGEAGGDTEIIKLYKNDRCSSQLLELNIDGQACAADSNDADGPCGVIDHSAHTDSLNGSKQSIDADSLIKYKFEILKEGKGIDISDSVAQQIQSNIKQESSVSVSGVVAPRYVAGSDAFVNSSNEARLHIGVNPQDGFKPEHSISVRLMDGNSYRGYSDASDFGSFDNDPNTACQALSGCSGVACRYAAFGSAYAPGVSKPSFTLKSGGYQCGGAAGVSLDGTAKLQEVVIEHRDGNIKSYQVISVDISATALP